jgi:hypothetical protein
MTDRTLSESSFSHVINVPIDRVDIADWLLHLTSDEYQRCCPGEHIAAGATTTDDGRPMSINVEMIGDALMIQQYVGELVGPLHCHLVSRSVAFTPGGRTTVQVIWHLEVEPIDERSCAYTNRVTAIATDEFLSFIAQQGISLDQARAARQQACGAHNQIETPRFAQSIERRALSQLVAA